MSDDDFLSRFESCSLSREEWTHEAHVRMGWLYLHRLPFADAVESIRAGIQRLNASFRRASSDAETTPDGYHDTITIALAHLISFRLKQSAAIALKTFSDFRAGNRDLFENARLLLLEHYSRELLDSREARQRFLDPDRKPLPK